MNFKKYNFMLAFLVALIIGIPIVSLSVNSSVEASNPLEDLPVVEVEETDEKPTSSTTLSTVEFSDGWQAYNHIKKSTLSKSYTSKTTQSLTASANLGITKLDLKQNVVVNVFKTKDGKVLEETYSTGTLDFFSSGYYDGEYVYSQKHDGKVTVGDRPAGAASKCSQADYVNQHGVLPGFVFDLSRANASVTSFKKSAGAGGYDFTISLKSSAWADYAKQVNIMSGSEKFPTINSISIDFKVTKFGVLKSMTISENYDIKHTGIDVNCTSLSVRQFSSVGADVKLPDLGYMGL